MRLRDNRIQFAISGIQKWELRRTSNALKIWVEIMILLNIGMSLILIPKNIRSTANMIKACVGSGLLAMPLAMRNAGYALGFIAAIVVGLICTYCMQMLMKTSQSVCKVKRVPMLGYAETCEAAFAYGSKKFRFLSKTLKIFADCTMLLTYLGSVCVYVVLMAESTKQIVDQYYPDSILSIEIYCLMLFLPLAILCQIKNLKFLAPFSIVENLMLVLVVGICLYYIFDQPITLEGKVPVNDLRQFPLFIATVLFAMEGIGVVLPIENDMAKPRNFLGCPGVLYISMTLVVSLYVILGTFGYLRFGSEVAGSITLNLPMDEWPAILAKVLIIITIFFSSALQFYVPIEILWRYSQPYVSKKHYNVTNVVLRTVAVALTVAMAVAIPLLKQVISIVGSLFFATLGIILPPIMQTVFTWDRISNIVIIKNLILVAFGLFAMVSGCTVAIQEIIEIQFGTSDE